MKEKYAYHGLFWFSPGEDVKIFDVDSGEELIEHTLSDLVDMIELPDKVLPYITDSPYYKEDTGVFVTIAGRSFSKVSGGPSYCGSYYLTDGYTCPIMVSTYPDCAHTNYYQQPAGTVEYEGMTWYHSSGGYGMGGRYPETDNFIGDFSSDEEAALELLRLIYES